jgi:hypothetical protein
MSLAGANDKSARPTAVAQPRWTFQPPPHAAITDPETASVKNMAKAVTKLPVPSNARTPHSRCVLLNPREHPP